MKSTPVRDRSWSPARIVDSIARLPDTRVLGICQSKPDGLVDADVRRYADLIIQRLIKAQLASAPAPYSADELAARLDLSALLASLGISRAVARSGGYVQLVDTNSGVSVQINADGSAGAGVLRPLVTLRGRTAAQIDFARDLGL